MITANKLTNQHFSSLLYCMIKSGLNQNQSNDTPKTKQGSSHYTQHTNPSQPLTDTKKIKKTKPPSQRAKTEAEYLVDPEEKDILDTIGEHTTNNALRPSAMTDYIGQTKLIKQLKIIIDSAKIRDKLPEHMLFYGQPGLGKTTMAYLVSNELHSHMKTIAAPALQKTGDIVSLLVNCEPNTVVFIDEIHRLRAPLEEILYSAMEDYQVDILVGKGQGTNTVKIDLAPFVLVGATTQLGRISKPLKDRFTNIFHLETYSDAEMFELVERSCGLLKLNLTNDAKIAVTRRSRGVPRIANKLLKRIVDVQTVKRLSSMSKDDVLDFLTELGVYEHGLTKTDIRYLQILQTGNLGLKTLSDILQEDPETIESVIEPYLTHLGFLLKSSEGRSISPKGLDYLSKSQHKNFD